VTKLYGLVVLTVAALVLGPARAQQSSDADWLACMEVWADESICGPQPAPEPPPPPPPPEEEPPPPPPPVEESPPPDACATGNHTGHAVASSGKANGHRCDDGRRSDDQRQQDGKRQNHVATAKALWNQFALWCSSLRKSGGRH